MAYQILVEKRVEKYLRRLQPKRYQRISELIHKLKLFPDVNADIAPLKGDYPDLSYVPDFDRAVEEWLEKGKK